MAAEIKEEYRGFVIAARQRNGMWQVRVEGIGALSAEHPTAAEAITEIRGYFDAAARD